MKDITTAIATAVKHAGGKAYVVGGSVRDELLGKVNKDIDIEVYGLRPDVLEELISHFGNVNSVGQAFSVFKLRADDVDVDVSIPRRESKAVNGRGHKAFNVLGDPDMQPEEAARRRDFTINALMKDPLTGNTLDFFGGLNDLLQGVIRAVDPETFVDDSLRVLRAAQFAARFNMMIDPTTKKLCNTVDLSDLPAERIFGEVEKMLLKSKTPSIGLQAMLELNILHKLFPELQAMVGSPQSPLWHQEGWSVQKLSSHSSVTGYTNTSRQEVTFNLREFINGTTTAPATIPLRGRAPGTQTVVDLATLSNISETLGAGSFSFSQSEISRETRHAETKRLVWSDSIAAAQTDEVVRIMFKIPLSCVKAVMLSTVQDLEVVRSIVQPVAIYVVNMFPRLKASAGHQSSENSVKWSTSIEPRPRGIHVTSVVADTTSTAIDGNVLFNFDLSVISDVDVHALNRTLAVHETQVELGDVFTHTRMVVDEAAKLIGDLPHEKALTVMLAALCHDIGKPLSSQLHPDGRITHHGHEGAGVAPTLELLGRLNVFTLNGYDVRSQVAALVENHMCPPQFFEGRAGNSAFRRLSQKVDMELLYRVSRADVTGRKGQHMEQSQVAVDWFLDKATTVGVKSGAPEPILMGRHLLEIGFKPGKEMGTALKAVFEMQLDGSVSTLEEALTAVEEMK